MFKFSYICCHFWIKGEMSSKLALLNCCFMWCFHALFSISILTCDWFNVLRTPLQEVERHWITRVKTTECSTFFHMF